VSGGDRREVSIRGDEGRSPRANTSMKRTEQRFWLRPRAGDRRLSSPLGGSNLGWGSALE